MPCGCRCVWRRCSDVGTGRHGVVRGVLGQVHVASTYDESASVSECAYACVNAFHCLIKHQLPNFLVICDEYAMALCYVLRKK